MVLVVVAWAARNELLVPVGSGVGARSNIIHRVSKQIDQPSISTCLTNDEFDVFWLARWDLMWDL